MTTQSRQLGRYELMQCIGEGGMGAVWLAKLTGAGGFTKLCLVKTVLPSIAKDADFVSRFLHEGRVLTQLSHSNIAQVYDMGDDGGELHIALEYVPGVTLGELHDATRKSNTLLPLNVATHVVQQVAEGLGYAHRRSDHDGKPLGIVHRDVSPQNVMLSFEGEVKVIDFGVARSEARSKNTAEATVLGKMGYMAPEQARGDQVDHRADQYACAIVLWELLTNTSFVPRGTLTEMVVAMANPRPRPLSPLRPDVPPSLEAAVLKALSIDPAQRYPTTDDFAHALRDELNRAGGIPSRQQLGDYVRTHCSERFQSNQKLISQVMTVRAPLPLTESAAVTSKATPLPVATLDATVASKVRPAVARAEPQAHAPMPQPTTGELQAAVKPSKAPFALAGLAVLALVVGVAWFALSRGAPQDSVAPPPTDRPGPAAVVAQPNPPAPVEPPAEVAVAQPAPSEAAADAGAADAPPPPPVAGATTATGTLAAPPQGGAVSATGAAVGAGPAVAAVKAVDPKVAKPAGKRSLSARLRMQRTPVWAITLTNTSGVAWSGCTVTVPGQLQGTLKALGKGFSREMPLQYFVKGGGAPNLNGEVLVECKQGSARLPAQE